MKKSLSVLLIFALLFSFGSLTVQAEDLENFDFIAITGGARITHYGGSETDVVVPAYVYNSKGEALPVREVHEDVFAYSDVRSVTFPDTVTTIVSEQFASCAKLESVQLGSSITSIGVSAFFDCSALKSVTIPDSVKTIGAGAFRDCTALETVTVGGGVTALPASLFDMCTALKTVYCGVNTQNVNATTFSGCFAEGGDLHIYDKTTSFAIDALPQGFSGTIHCYPDSPIDDLATKLGYNIAYYNFDRLYATTETPLQVIENPEPQAMPTAGLRILAAYTEAGTAVPPRDVTDKCTIEQTRLFDTPGSVQIPVSYKTYSTTFTVTVLENIETGLEIVKAPNKGSYYADADKQTIETEGLQVMVSFLDGTKKDVTANCTVPAEMVFDTVGTAYVTVSYHDFTANFPVNILEDTVLSLEIASAPTKAYYASKRPQTVQTEGLKVNRVHISGKRVDVTADCVVPNTQVFSAVGADTVTVTYGEMETSFAVTVLENIETGIEIAQTPSKAFYYRDSVMQTVATDGLQVLLCHINGEKDDITDKCTVPAEMRFDTVGAIAVPVQYKTFSTSFAVTVLEDTQQGVEVVALPQKTMYYQSSVPQTVSTEGLRVELCFASGKRVDVTADCVVADRQLFDRLGSADVTVTYKGFAASFAVTVVEDCEIGIEIAKTPTDTRYYAAENLQTVSTEGLQVLAVFLSGKKEDVTSRCTLEHTRRFATAGTTKIPVTYKGLNAEFPATVEEAKLTLTVGGAAVAPVYLKKISLFSSYKRNPVTFGFAGVDAARMQTARWQIAEGAQMTVQDGKVTYSKISAGTGVVRLTVTDNHGAELTAEVRVIFYRLNIQLPLKFKQYL